MEDRGGGVEAGERIGRYVVVRGCDPEYWDSTCVASDGGREVEITFFPAVEGVMPEIEALLRVIRALPEPAIRRAFEVGVHRGWLWIAVESVEGATLGRWGRRRTWKELLDVMREVGEVLAAAHEVGLGALDFSIDDVSLAEDGRVIVDLPRAAVGSCVMATRRGGARLRVPARAPLFIAPECWAGRELSEDSDQFAFCGGYWRVLFGEHPFPGETIIEIANAAREGRRRPPPAGTQVPGWLIAALGRGLAVDPGDRFPSMRALVAELGRRRGWFGWLRRG